MYPFNAFLIGLIASNEDRLKTELLAHGLTVEGEFPTVEAVLGQKGHNDATPRLLLVYDTSNAIAASVRRLRERYASWPILAFIEPGVDSSALLAANRAGADQVVALPLITADFGEALNRLEARYGQIERPPLVVAVSGTIPGAGATTLATVLASEIAAGYATRTVLIEAALRMGVLAMNLNAKPNIFLTDLLAEADTPDADLFRKALVSVAPRLELLAAPPDLTRAIPNSAPGMLKLLTLCRKIVPATIIDLPCTYDDLQFETLWAADQVVLVGNQSLPSVRTAKMILDAAAHTKTVKRVYVLLNKYDTAIGGLTAEKVSEALGGVVVLTVPNDFAAVMRAANEGRLLRDLAPKSPVVAAIRDLARAVMGAAPTAAESRLDGRNLLTRVLGFFKTPGG